MEKQGPVWLSLLKQFKTGQRVKQWTLDREGQWPLGDRKQMHEGLGAPSLRPGLGRGFVVKRGIPSDAWGSPRGQETALEEEGHQGNWNSQSKKTEPHQRRRQRAPGPPQVSSRRAITTRKGRNHLSKKTEPHQRRRQRAPEPPQVSSRRAITTCKGRNHLQPEKEPPAWRRGNQPHNKGRKGVGLFPSARVKTSTIHRAPEKDGEGNGTPLQYSCLENPMGGGAWWAAVHGVAKSWTRLSDFTFTFHFHALEKETATHSSTLAWRILGTEEPGELPCMGSHRVDTTEAT